jgi:hypothetical protein
MQGVEGGTEMKRRITIKQLNELTDEQKQKLREQWKPQEGDWVYDAIEGTHIIVLSEVDYRIGSFLYSKTPFISNDGIRRYEPTTEIKKYWLPLLDISQMIELLQNNPDKVKFDYDETIVVYKDASKSILKADTYFVGLHDTDMCDKLWQAVKAVL